MVLEISFPTATSADANIFARELRRELADCGIPASAISVHRKNPENMDLGGALELGRQALEAIAALHSSYVVGQAIHSFCKRNRSTVRIKSPIANIDLATDAADPARLAEILKKIAEMHRGGAER
jgi:sugar phosphate isomerase/epimerase